MTTDATLSAYSATRREASSTTWFWWKETRQLAPLIVLLIVVALLIMCLNTIVSMAMTRMEYQLPHEVIMLVLPGLFATGAGPLLVGQERAQRTIDWLLLLPISAKRLASTKLLVAISGLAVMWIFSLLIVFVLDLGSQASWRWIVGSRDDYSGNGSSYPVWMTHSLFILMSGFYVAWRIKNQFYSLIALIPLAFSPFILTSLVSEFSLRPLNTGALDWINFGFTLLGILVVTPLTYRAAMRALGPAAAPSVKPLIAGSAYSPTRELEEAIAPTFRTQTAPIIWQSLHSAKGMLAILIGMLLISFLVAMRLSSIDHYRGIDRMLPWLLLLAPLAVCWLGISVFKHDGAFERVRFLADRGVSPHKTYFALHAVPTAILCTAAVVYGLWNLTISHRSDVSNFASALPTLVTMLLFVLMIYSLSQWVSQFVRTLILSVILAPILSLMVGSWLTFAYVALGLPEYAFVFCSAVPLIATFVMMRRYMDSRDRPLTFLVAAGVVTLLIFVPVGFAAAHVLSVPRFDSGERSRLMTQWDRMRDDAVRPMNLSMNAFSGAYADLNNHSDDKIEEMKRYLSHYSLDPMRLVQPIAAASQRERVAAHLGQWEFNHWVGGMMQSRFRWRQDRDDAAWESLADWMRASAILLPALRRSPLLPDQEIADRLEVLMIDTLQFDVPADRRQDSASQAAIAAIGTPKSRAEARRRAVLATWSNHFQDDRGRPVYHYLMATEHVPPGLVEWIRPRLYDSMVQAMLEGIEAAEKHVDESRWRRSLHSLQQTGGVFETSGFGDRMRSMPAIETVMIGRFSGYGQLWGQEWEYVDPAAMSPRVGR